VGEPSQAKVLLPLKEESEIDGRRAIKGTPTVSAPVFFIYATPGQGGESLNPTYYAAANEPKEIWAADGGHTGAISAEPEEYERRVVAFLDRALLNEGAER
jgi:hypothetical protein